MKESANKNGNQEQAGRGGDVGGQRGRGAGSGRGAGRGDSVPDRGGRAGVGGGRGGQTGGAPSRGGIAPRGARGNMAAPAAAPPVSRAPPPPQAAQPAAPSGPIRDAPTPTTNKWSNGRPPLEEPPKPVPQPQYDISAQVEAATETSIASLLGSTSAP